jgi:hypothetical protein
MPAPDGKSLLILRLVGAGKIKIENTELVGQEIQPERPVKLLAAMYFNEFPDQLPLDGD